MSRKRERKTKGRETHEKVLGCYEPDNGVTKCDNITMPVTGSTIDKHCCAIYSFVRQKYKEMVFSTVVGFIPTELVLVAITLFHFLIL